MPLRPFPWPLNVGIDIASVHRVRAIISTSHDKFRRYMRRFLTPQERRIILRRYGDADLTDPRTILNMSHFLAGRWAAKEATIKAVTWRKLTFHDIVIRYAQPPGGCMQAIILDRTATNEDHADSVPPPDGLQQNDAHSGDKNFLDAMHSSTQSLDNETKSLPATNASGPEAHQEDSGVAHFKPQIVDDAQASRIYEDEVLQNLSGQIAQISISHDGGYATAVCLAAQEPLEGDVGGELAARRL